MASLTQIAVTSRRIIRYGIYLIIFLIVGRIVLGLTISIIKRVFPAPPPPPTVAYGKLPKLAFPTKTDLPQFEYKLETTTGNLPTLPTQAKIFVFPPTSANLLSLDAAKQKALSLGFSSEPTPVSQTLYKFDHPRVPATLEMNIVSGIFSVSYNLAQDPAPLSTRPPAPEVATTNVKSFLSTAGVLPDDLTGPTTPQFLKVESKKLVPAVSLSEANLVKINLFRKDYDKLPTLTSDPNQANVWFILSGDQSREKQIVAGEFHYFPVDETQFSTYPLKTAQDAFTDLNSGKGYIANLGKNPTGKITIRKVYLAYYDPGQEFNFLEPIVVFQGDNDFVAYVPAVTSSYYSE
jgi:hypothetical protein